MIKPEEGLWEPQFIAHLSDARGGGWGLSLASEVGESCGIEPLAVSALTVGG